MDKANKYTHLIKKIAHKENQEHRNENNAYPCIETLKCSMKIKCTAITYNF